MGGSPPIAPPDGAGAAGGDGGGGTGDGGVAGVAGGTGSFIMSDGGADSAGRADPARIIPVAPPEPAAEPSSRAGSEAEGSCGSLTLSDGAEAPAGFPGAPPSGGSPPCPPPNVGGGTGAGVG